MNEYVKKEELVAIIKALPVANISGVELFTKNRILKTIEFLSVSEITTKLRRNRFSQVYCQNCEGIIPMSSTAAEQLTHCPHCELPIKECKFDN
jgi:hypothetical protein